MQIPSVSLVFSKQQQPTAASIFKCGKSLAHVRFRELLGTGAGY